MAAKVRKFEKKISTIGTKRYFVITIKKKKKIIASVSKIHLVIKY